MNNLVTFEQQLALRELGFNKGSYTHYFLQDKEGHWKRGDLVTHHYDHVHDLTMFDPVPEVIPANTIYEAATFLRSLDKIISVNPTPMAGKLGYKFSILYTKYDVKFKTYEKALSAGVDECIKILQDESSSK